jgi:hypothetical protein
VIRREKELPPGQRNPADDTVMSDLQQAIRKLSAPWSSVRKTVDASTMLF